MLAGSTQTAEVVHLQELELPEFDKNRKMDEVLKKWHKNAHFSTIGILHACFMFCHTVQ